MEKTGRKPGDVGERWDDMCRALVEYKEKHGNTLVPQKYIHNRDSSDSMRLGRWVNYVRSQTEKGISTVRREELREIGFQWHVRYKWKDMLEHLLDYKKAYGDCQVPKCFEMYGVRLGRWVTNQRNEYSRRSRGHKHHITQEQVDALEAIGFVWFTQERYRITAPRHATADRKGDGETLVAKESNTRDGEMTRRHKEQENSKAKKRSTDQSGEDSFNDDGIIWL